MAAPASPRLPSPPPIPEDQLSPISASPEQQKLFSNLDHAAERRIRPGTKAQDMAEGPPLVELSEVGIGLLMMAAGQTDRSTRRSTRPFSSLNTSKHYIIHSHILTVPTALYL